VSEPNRVTRILEGLATQAIWQALAFLVSAGFVSLGVAKLWTAAHAFSTAFNVFLVVVGLAGMGWVLGIVPRWRKGKSDDQIAEKIVIVADPRGAMIYINEHREAIDFPFLTLRNFSRADVDVEPFDVQIGGSSRVFGMTRAQFNSPRVGKLGGIAQVTIASYNLTAKDLEFIETTCRHPGYFDLALSATLRIKVSLQSFDIPFGITARAGVLRTSA
jgi:hypothetical protein